MGRRRMAAGSIAVAMAVALLAASCVINGTWALASPGAPPGSDGGELIDVACPTDTSCLAVGLVWEGVQETPWVESWDGATWAPVDFEPYAFGDDIEITGVACGTATACAIAWHPTPGDWPPMVSVWNGSWWDQPAYPDLDHDATGSAVACAPDGSCVFASQFSPTVVWDGDTFTTYAFDEVTGTGITPAISDLSCVSIDHCVGIDAGGRHVVRWNGSSWSSEALEPLPGGSGTTYRSIACTSTDRCVVVGERDQGSPSLPVPVAAVGDGTTWTEVAVPLTDGRLRSVSCANRDACVAVGATKAGLPVAAAWTGGTWYKVADPPGPAYSSYRAIGCSTGTRCVAVGQLNDDPIAAVYTYPP